MGLLGSRMRERRGEEFAELRHSPGGWRIVLSMMAYCLAFSTLLRRRLPVGLRLMQTLFASVGYQAGIVGGKSCLELS